MSKLATPLVPVNIDRYKPKAEEYTVPDAGGLCFQIFHIDAKSRQVRYKSKESKATRITVGNCPAMSLSDARAAALEVHAVARGGQPIFVSSIASGPSHFKRRRTACRTGS